MNADGEGKISVTFLVVVLVLFLSPFLFAAEYRLTIDAERRGPTIPKTLYGIFFEDINHAVDGGLYAELVQNRSFEHGNPREGWVFSGSRGTRLSVEDDAPFAPESPHYLRVQLPASGGWAEVRNEGYGGIPLKQGERYFLSFFARAEVPFSGSFEVILEERSGKRCGTVVCKESFGASWQKYTVPLVPWTSSPSARLVLRIQGRGTLDLDVISLFPEDTWKGRAGGLRKDLVTALLELKPGFLRFPGGCIVEGDSLANAYRFKRTLGPPERRMTRWNLWGYYQSFGLGFFEYFLLAEDLGAEPVPVVNAGMSCQFRGAQIAPLEAMGEWIQDALDLIEYARGETTTPWGKRRKDDGHPEPFRLKYLAIGNENWGEEYCTRFALFQEAIKKQYPDIQLIFSCGPFPEGPVFDQSWEWAKAHEVDVVDEHMYMPPQWFLANAHRYDGYDREGPKVMVGEYAAHTFERQSNLEAALAEAAFMTGLERNADVVVMAAYAPLLGRLGWSQWTPDLLYFDGTSVLRTPSYYVQYLFSTNLGTWVLPSVLEVSGEDSSLGPIRGAVGLGSSQAQVAFDTLQVVSATGNTLFLSNFEGEQKRQKFRGIWEVRGGVLRQRSFGEDCRIYFGDTAWSEYTVEAWGKRLSSEGGLLLLFGVQDDFNYYVWNLEGSGRGVSTVERVAGGARMVLERKTFSGLPRNGFSALRVAVEGRRIRCFLDGRLIHDLEDTVEYQPLYHVASYDARSSEVILKVVNPFPEPKVTRIVLAGNLVPTGEGKALVLASKNPGDENTLSNPDVVSPRETPLCGLSRSLSYTFLPFSVTVLRIATFERRKADERTP